MTRAISLALASLIFLVAGCGTLNNMIVGTPSTHGEVSAPLEVYGGVRRDLRDLGTSMVPPYSWNPTDVLERTMGIGVTLIDLPLSAVGDTLTLGRTVPATRSESK